MAKPKLSVLEATFAVTLTGQPWTAGGDARTVRLQVVHDQGRPDGLLAFLGRCGRGAVDCTLRVNRVETTTSWRGIATIDSATWKPGGDGKKTHPHVELKMAVTEDANNGPATLRKLVAFRLDLDSEDLQQVEMEVKPYDGPLFAAEPTEDVP